MIENTGHFAVDTFGTDAESNLGPGGSHDSAKDGKGMNKQKRTKGAASNGPKAVDSVLNALYERRAQYAKKLKEHWAKHKDAPLPAKPST